MYYFSKLLEYNKHQETSIGHITFLAKRYVKRMGTFQVLMFSRRVFFYNKFLTIEFSTLSIVIPAVDW